MKCCNLLEGKEKKKNLQKKRIAMLQIRKKDIFIIIEYNIKSLIRLDVNE